MLPHRLSAARISNCLAAIILLVTFSACDPGTPVDTMTNTAVPTAHSTSVPVETTSATPQPSSTATSELAVDEIPAAPEATASPIPINQDRVYSSQPGDTWIVIANRFSVIPADLTCLDPCPIDPNIDMNVLLPYGTKILAPTAYKSGAVVPRLLPDSEVIFSAAASNFNVTAYLQATNGFLNGHKQYLMMNAWNSGAEVIELVATENSINPRILLALLEHQCGCVLGDIEQVPPFMGATSHNRKDLYGQLVWAVHELSDGYYGWRSGTLTELKMLDGTTYPLHPDLNAGTVAIYNLFSKLYSGARFQEEINLTTGFASTFREMFGNPWLRELLIYPDGISQPLFDLPFEPGLTWSYTGGPHAAFEGSGPLASLDFAPASAEPGCQPTPGWVTAVADGLVVRSEFGLVTQDLDGDGDEQTGWVVMYLHIGKDSRVPVGTRLERGQRIGQPSCEGGTSNGTHVHIARKLNGEWISAGSGPNPFVLSGWTARDGVAAYKGTLQRDETILEACTCSWRQSWIENASDLD